MIITNIQRFCLHDGPGIRTTVFFKGCNLRCPWCSNPENLEFNIQHYKIKEEIGTYGYEITLQELENEILKDKSFYDETGGVTFSGGECLLQFKELENLLKKLKQENINICIETALTVPCEFVEIALKYVDEFIIDLKILEENVQKKINENVKLYKENVKRVLEKNKKVTFRIPLVPKYTATDGNIAEILEFLKYNKPEKVEMFTIHNLAEIKYKTLNKEIIKFEELQEDKINNIKTKIESLGINVEIIKI